MKLLSTKSFKSLSALAIKIQISNFICKRILPVPVFQFCTNSFIQPSTYFLCPFPPKPDPGPTAELQNWRGCFPQVSKRDKKDQGNGCVLASTHSVTPQMYFFPASPLCSYSRRLCLSGGKTVKTWPYLQKLSVLDGERALCCVWC